nr:hypothetical protein [Ktedonobacteraceae bacterium]
MKDATAISTNTTKPGARFEVYREILPKVLRSPVTWALALIMLLSAGYLLWIGQGKLLISSLVIVIYSVIMMLATLPLTAGKPEAAWEVTPIYSRTRFWLQIGVILLLWLLLQFIVFEGNGVLNLSLFALPLLNAFYQNTLRTIVGAFIIQALVAIGLMRLMGARWSELGFSKGYRSWSVVALWSTPWIVATLIALLLGHATVPLILGNLLISFFIAAIPEEFLFRGVLMT